MFASELQTIYLSRHANDFTNDGLAPNNYIFEHQSSTLHKVRAACSHIPPSHGTALVSNSDLETAKFPEGFHRHVLLSRPLL